MKILDPGHLFELNNLDGEQKQILRFVKREGIKYPGNVGAYQGTTNQEVLRALVSRLEYVNSQTPCMETQAAINLLKTAIILHEVRAARVHGQVLIYPSVNSFMEDVCCIKCGHVKCKEHAIEN